MIKDYMFHVNDSVALTDSNGLSVHWASGTLDIPADNHFPSPTIIKMISLNPDFAKGAGATVKLDIDHDLYMLPTNHEPNAFFGSDCISGEMFYGQSDIINGVFKEIDNLVTTQFNKTSCEPDYGLNTLMQWDFENGTSVLFFFNESNTMFTLPESLSKQEVLYVPFGAEVDDHTVSDFLTRIVYKDIKKFKVDGEKQIDMDDYKTEDGIPADADAAEFVTYHGRLYRKSDRPAILYLTHKLICEFLQWQTITDDDVEDTYWLAVDRLIARKLQLYKESLTNSQ